MSELNPFLETDRLYLEKLSLKHCQNYYLNWLHDQDVNQFLETGHIPNDLMQLESFISSINPTEIFLAIHTKSGNKHIGNIRIHSLNAKHGLAEYGIMLGDKTSWGNGYAKEATVCLLEHCFQKLNIRKITLGVVEDNVGALKMYEKIGFVKEGVLVKHCFYNGGYKDIVRMALFQTDWLNEK
tara:strand:+ start:9306 stop:9854 length:549 start_codon:yes stop_codon:yes gene_type:complete